MVSAVQLGTMETCYHQPCLNRGFASPATSYQDSIGSLGYSSRDDDALHFKHNILSSIDVSAMNIATYA